MNKVNRKKTISEIVKEKKIIKYNKTLEDKILNKQFSVTKKENLINKSF